MTEWTSAIHDPANIRLNVQIDRHNIEKLEAQFVPTWKHTAEFTPQPTVSCQPSMQDCCMDSL